MNNVENFINSFCSSTVNVEEFNKKCSYWFAQVLFLRFIRENASLMYDVKANHFGTKIGREVYDATGKVTFKYKWTKWRDISDNETKETVKKTLVNLEEKV